MEYRPTERGSATKTSELSERLAAIRANFVDQLIERCLDIDALSRALGQNEIDADLFDRAAHHIHKIAGVAATLGFERLGKLAAQTDEMIVTQGSDVSGQTILDLLESLLDEIEEVLEAHAPS